MLTIKVLFMLINCYHDMYTFSYFKVLECYLILPPSSTSPLDCAWFICGWCFPTSKNIYCPKLHIYSIRSFCDLIHLLKYVKEQLCIWGTYEIYFIWWSWCTHMSVYVGIHSCGSYRCFHVCNLWTLIVFFLYLMILYMYSNLWTLINFSLLCFSITTCGYIVLQLFQVSYQDPIYHVLLNSHSKYGIATSL